MQKRWPDVTAAELGIAFAASVEAWIEWCDMVVNLLVVCKRYL